MARISIAAAAALALLLGGVHAQAGAPGQKSERAAPKQVSLDLYSEADSRAYFAACDANGDDRLSVLEARTALLLDPDEAVDQFRRIDRQMHGYLSFPDFDAEYRGVVNRGGTFHIQPARTPVLGPRGAVGVDLAPARRVIGLFDKDGDNALDPAELQGLLEKRRINEDPRKLFTLLDTDGTGRLVATELVTFASVPELLAPPQPDLTTRQRLSQKWQESDLDQDGAIAENELERELRLIDPRLARWTKKVLVDADTSKNGTLNADEVSAASVRGDRLALPPHLKPTPAQLEQIKALHR